MALRSLCVCVIVPIFASGCVTGSASTMAGAATMTTMALGAAALNRSQGGCVAICTNGTACNPRTGLCEVLPCRGRCGDGEHCEDSFTGGKCVPGGTTGVATAARPTGGTKLPVTGQPIDTSSSSGPPQIVPKAEQTPPPASGK
jgi:hypothetical protein